MTLDVLQTESVTWGDLPPEAQHLWRRSLAVVRQLLERQDEIPDDATVHVAKLPPEDSMARSSIQFTLHDDTREVTISVATPRVVLMMQMQVVEVEISGHA